MTTKDTAPKDTSQKDVIYIDVDDEITAVIDKVQSSSSKIVALVLPKRASVMQSVVNMKLLKRSAEAASKRLVLITTEAGVMPLAGMVGMYVASTPSSKPVIPVAPVADTGPVEVDSNDIASLSDGDAKTAPLVAAAVDNDAPIEIDNDDKASAAAATSVVVKGPRNNKLKVPDFNKFRTRLFLGGGLIVLLLIGWFVAATVLPKAVVTVKTDSVNVTSDLNLIASTEAAEFNEAEMIVRAQNQELKKTDVQKVPATGKEDRGTKSSGSVTFVNCSGAEGDVTIPAGTGVSNGSVTFITQTAVELDEAIFNRSDECRPGAGQTGQSRVVAQSNGDGGNLSARAYTVAGYDSGLRAQGSDMTGGTSNIITVVSQADIDGAAQKSTATIGESAKQELVTQLQTAKLIPLDSTFVGSAPTTTTAPGVGAEAAEVTVTTVTTYSMMGVNSDDIKQFVEADIKSKINGDTQVILSNGIEQAIFKDVEKVSAVATDFNIQVIGSAGVKQDDTEIRNAIKGMKKGDVETELNGRPGVREIEIKYSPFWVTRTPSNPDKIVINFEQIAANE